ncbi:uncharacterized protein BKCO1_27000117 [Diplodia corticola]|uniref:DUF7924 domain-containing protein n=1 Tax=Diplodia corticola TaxID=236234 RepID=A0A1J9S190_9PEZI|nr:uncharacterized protein BKCO1_27000117 [Diplodia corticola]OJD33788.1 hypothetical protein BKCO1_27000117 [Diplodia corticola]
MAPQTRFSTLRRSGRAAASPAKTITKPTATATATGRRGRPKKKPLPSAPATRRPVQKPASSLFSGQSELHVLIRCTQLGKGRQDAQVAAPKDCLLNTADSKIRRGNGRSVRLTSHCCSIALTGRGQQDQLGTLQPQNPLPPNPNLAPERRNQRRKRRGAKDTVEASPQPRQEDIHPIRSWLQGTPEVPPTEDIMAGSARRKSAKAVNPGDILRIQALQRIQNQSQNGATEQEESASQPNGSRASDKRSPDYKKRSHREMLEYGVDGVSLIMAEVKQNQSDADLKTESRTLLQTLTTHSRKKVSDEAPGGKFHQDTIEALLERMHMQNERGVAQEMSAVVCPSAGALGDRSSSDKKLKETYSYLVNLWDQPWERSVLAPVFTKPPQPDYCVGFSRKAFSQSQRDTLTIMASEKTTFMQANRMYFPFLTCEVKAPTESIEVADNQNGYSMLVAVRSMVDLFRAAKTDFTGSGHIMAFSISYNHEWVYIHAYYPILDGEETTIYRRKVYKYNLSPDETTDTRRSWNFVRNVYEIWAPRLRDRLRDAIDAVAFNMVHPSTQAASEPSAQSHVRRSTAPRDPDAMSIATDGASNASPATTRRAASEHDTEGPAAKRPRR